MITVLNAAEIVLCKGTVRPFDLNNENDKELFESIKNNGILVPIIIKKQGKGYIILDGARRYQAALALRMMRIPVEIIK
jgi:ParB family transcriptional regulator, chromosome partitioning protein